MRKYKYLIFNKPINTLSTLDSIVGRKTLRSHLGMLKSYPLYIIGHLSYGFRGALLIINNGILAYKLMHFLSNADERYVIKIKGIPSISAINNIKRRYSNLRLKNIGVTKCGNTWLEVNTYKAKAINNIFWELNSPILKVIRLSLANINIANLKEGHVRSLTPYEVLSLYNQIKV